MSVQKVTHNRQADIGIERELRDIVTVLNSLVEKIGSPSTSLPSDLSNQSIQVVRVGANQYSLAVRSVDGFVYVLPGLLTKVGSTLPTAKSNQVIGAGSDGNALWKDVSTVGAVTNVTGTSPIASSGGATPAISLAKATGSVDGYLSHTDWTTFNNKLDSTSVPGIRKGATSLTANIDTTITYSSPLSGTVDVLIISCQDSTLSDVEKTISSVTTASFHALCPVNATLKWMVVQDI